MNKCSSMFLCSTLIITHIYAGVILKDFVFSYVPMLRFLFQPDSIDGVCFNPIKIDIHQGVIKIVDDEIFYDFQLNEPGS